MKFTQSYSDKIAAIREKLDCADKIVIGAGAGLSTSAGFTYSGERFEKHFSDFGKKYGFRDMYSGGFYPYATEEEFWGYWSRYIYVNRYSDPPKPVYDDLLKLVQDKNYFVLTTNVDHCFQKAGFAKERMFYTQGDYGLFQCSVPCHDKTYDNEEIVRRMWETQKDGKVPSELLPRCPVCGKKMTMNLRSDDTFVQDKGWYAAAERYEAFMKDAEKSKVVYFELGVGNNTPVIIKYPFWQRTYANPDATYVCVNKGDAYVPNQISSRSVAVDADIGEVLADLLGR